MARSAPLVRRRPRDERGHAGSAELLFDLVFVLAVTQVSRHLGEHLDVRGAAESAIVLLAAWWAWMYTTWVTNWFDPETLLVRAVLVVGVVASMLGAIAIPDAFGERAWLFVAGYVGVQSARNAFIVLATDRDDELYRPVLRIFAWNGWVALVWIAGALAHGDTRLAIWAVALVADYAGPYLGHWTPGLGRTDPSEWELEPGHFVERIGLFIIIALGESIVDAGLTASALEVTASRLAAVLVCLGITIALWWLYFHLHAERALAALEAADEERGRLGRELSYISLPVVAGIIVAAVGHELVIAHPGDALHGRELTALAAGPALYLLGSVAFKARILRMRWQRRFAAAVLVAAAVAAGRALPALATWTLVLAILTGLAVVEAMEDAGDRAGD